MEIHGERGRPGSIYVPLAPSGEATFIGNDTPIYRHEFETRRFTQDPMNSLVYYEEARNERG